MKKIVFATLLAALSTGVIAAETVRFATEATYAPFEFVGADNKIQGFDIDLANALCKQMQAECIFTNQGFDSLIPSLRFRRFNAVISGMDITPDRLKQVAFTHPYYENSAIFVAQKGKCTDMASLAGKRVGMQNGSTHQKYLMDKHPEIIAVPYDSYQNAILDLKNGRLDSVFGDTAVGNEWLMKAAGLATVGEKVTDKAYFGSGLGIAVRQNNTALLNKCNQALDKIRQDGTYQSLYQKWFKQ